MNFAWAACGATVGLVAGIAMRGLVFRLSVPSGQPDRTACPGCAARVGGWPGLRCRSCGRTLGPVATLAISTAVVLALIAGKFAEDDDIVA